MNFLSFNFGFYGYELFVYRLVYLNIESDFFEIEFSCFDWIGFQFI